jgi:CubicO group peptidase (beta-lactamase class C family)
VLKYQQFPFLSFDPETTRMVYRLAGRSAVLLSLAAGMLDAQLPPGNRSTARDDSLRRYLRTEMAERKIPGLQVAIVRGGRVVFRGAYGIANLQYGLPVTDTTVFSINSATKAFTGVAILQLVERGLVDLSAPVSTYLDSLPAAWQPVTIRQLLSHISGIPDVLDEEGDLPLGETESQALRRVAKLPMAFVTGERFRYNQTNYLLLGRVIRKLSGQRFPQFAAQQQLAPAGMLRTGFGDSRDVIRNKSQSYRFVPLPDDTASRQLTNVFERFPEYLWTAAGMNSTADDVARWIIALQNGSLLKRPGSLTAMWAVPNWNDGKPNWWALGWPAITRPEHRARAGIGGGRSAFFIYPDDDLAIVVLTNLSGGSPEDFIDGLASFYLPGLAGTRRGAKP